MGKFWEHNDCVVLFWNNEKQVVGLKIEKKGGKLTVLDTASSTPETEQLSIALSEVENKLVATETHLMLVGGNLPGSVSFDINIPKMSIADMRQAIAYELPRNIPCDPQDVIFGYRITDPKDDAPETKKTVRIIAVMKKNWNEILSEMSGSGVKVDAFITPFLAVDPILGNDDEIIFQDGGTTLSFTKSSDSPGRKIIVKDSGDSPNSVNELNYREDIKKIGFHWEELPSVIKKTPQLYFPALIIAAYGLSQEFPTDRSSLIRLPSELIPERFRTLRTAFFCLIGAIILLVLMLVGRLWWESVSRYKNIQNEIVNVNIRKQKVKSQQNQLKTKVDLIRDITESKRGNAEIVTCINKITQELPKDMWMGHFQSRDDSIDISFRYIKSGLSKPNFNKMAIFNTITSSSRNDSRTGTVTEYVRLKYIPPEKRDGKK